jgi:hypothetical protein
MYRVIVCLITTEREVGRLEVGVETETPTAAATRHATRGSKELSQNPHAPVSHTHLTSTLPLLLIALGADGWSPKHAAQQG